MKILVITGPPYSGKGTQCEILEETLKFKHISTGERIRAEKDNNTKIGLIMKEYEEKGMLVPDEIMEELLTQVIVENENEKGMILDGYPRTSPQVDTLIKLLKEKDKEVNQVINIEVPKDELLNRARERAKKSTREDDKDVKTHMNRIEVFEASTKPAIEYFRAKIKVDDIDGTGTIEEITNRIQSKLRQED